MFYYHHQILPPLFPIYFFLINKFIIITLDLQTITDRIITEPTQKIHCSLSRSFFMEFFAYLHYQFKNPILFQEKTFKLSMESLLTFVKINYPIADHKSIILTQNYHEEAS